MCEGLGKKRIPMHFLPDVWVTYSECGGKRFKRQILEITCKGKSIADVLDMDVQESLNFFAEHPKIALILRTLHDVGLDYLKLAQGALTLSGGETQRVKLAKELSREDIGDTLYILDEPTTGLHFADIQKLLEVLHRLTEDGTTVIIIEHNLDMIKTADWIIGEKNVQDAPDLVVEILSETTAYNDLVKKKKLYAKFGVQEYWIVDPGEKNIDIYSLEGDEFNLSSRFSVNDILESPLLPGLKIELISVFSY